MKTVLTLLLFTTFAALGADAPAGSKAQTNSPAESRTPTNSFSESPVPTNSFSESPVPTNSFSESPVPTNSFSESPVQTNAALSTTNLTAQTNSPFSITNLTLQILEPTGGKILRPKDWFYTESHGESSYTWILSREDASKAPYTTGVRIEILVNVKARSGRTAKEYVLDFVERKKKEAAKVIKTCPEEKQKLFTRVCLETEEGPHRILYSIFWGNDMDIAVVSIAGTKKELWETYAPTFNVMSSFELIDMKRFESGGPR